MKTGKMFNGVEYIQATTLNNKVIVPDDYNKKLRGFFVQFDDNVLLSKLLTVIAREFPDNQSYILGYKNETT